MTTAHSKHYSVDMEPAVLASSARILPEQVAWAGRVVAGTYATDADDLRDLLAMLDVDPAAAKAWRAGKPLLLAKRKAKGGRRR